MEFHGKKVIFGKIEDGENIDIESRMEALAGDKGFEENLDKKAERIQAAKERRKREEQRAKQRQQAEQAAAAAVGIDILCDLVTTAAKSPTVRKGAKITAKATIAVGASWLVYRGVKFIVDKM